MIDLNHPFYRPRWRRLLIIAICLLWVGFEALFGGNGAWLIIACSFAAPSLWFLLIKWKDPPSSSA